MDFWDAVKAQLKKAHSAKTADDVLSIFSKERNPYGHESMAAEGFFAGGGGDDDLDDDLDDALYDAGWRYVWSKASYHWCMRAPNGDLITYVEGDLYRGNQRPMP